MATKRKAIVPLNSFFSSKPVPHTKKIERVSFTSFDGRIIEGYIYKGQKCLTLEDLTNYIPKGKYDTVKAAFGRAREDFEMKEGTDFIQVRGEKLSLLGISQKKYIYLLNRSGVLLTLSAMNKKYKSKLLYFLVHYYFHEEDRKQLIDYTPLGPTFPDGNLVSKDLIDCRSKNELIVANLFYSLNLVLRRKDFMSIDRFSNDLSRDLLKQSKWSGLNFDFFVPLTPLTLVDVTTREAKNDFKNALKEEICGLEGWDLFRIYEDEIRNLPLLEQRIKKHFNLTG